MRCALEGMAFEEICAITDRTAIVRELQEYLEALRDTEGDFVAQLNADLALHERMCALSGNGTLTHTWLGVSGLARAAVTAAGPETALHNMSYERHLPIVTCCRGGRRGRPRVPARAHAGRLGPHPRADAGARQRLSPASGRV